ncbi:MAG: transketolase [Oligoflexia bacterium]|nr:transketolase [Oligoflexia bacterium]
MKDEIALNSREFKRAIASKTLKLISGANTSHIGGCLSVADILAVLFCDILRYDSKKPQCKDRDRLLLSKGHACAILYAALAQVGIIKDEELQSFAKDGSLFLAHTSHLIPGIEFSTGSLGHGLPVACGMALAARRQQASWRSYVIVGDGDLNEGSSWEAIFFAAHHKLDNLTLIVDHNKIYSADRVETVVNMMPLVDKFSASGWKVCEVDGHDHQALKKALAPPSVSTNSPRCVVAHTIKGKGVSFMENNGLWHYRPPNPQQLAQALLEIEEKS